MRLSLVLLVALAALAASVAALRADANSAASPPGRPLVTAVVPSEPVDNALLFRRVRASGATVVRWTLPWRGVAPSRPPTREEARDPSWSGYHWGAVDASVKLAARHGIEPLLTLLDPPAWAADLPPKRPHGPWNVDAAAYGDFARAAATRYSGSFEGLPRVRLWMAWNEPNLGTYLNPQFAKPYAYNVYRGLVNALADAVRAVHVDNLVVAGGTAPFTAWNPRTKRKWGMGPLTFMRGFLCLSASPRPRPTCSARARFDVWAHHPYTTGGPTHTAFRAQDVSLGDLPQMRAVLDAAVRHRKIVSRGRPQFWVTEFSWDTNPPDKGGVPAQLHARWTAEALHQMWKSGVSLVTWFGVRDEAYPERPFQSGLYYRNGRPKPALHAFRFPFVAKPLPRGRASVWGRTPNSRAGVVRIEQATGAGWRRLATVRASRHGVFVGSVRLAGSGRLRARADRQSSRPFALTGVKNKRYYPFGDWRP